MFRHLAIRKGCKMKNLRNNQYGFHAVEAVLVIVVLVGVGFAGWRIIGANTDSSSTAEDTTASQVAEVQVMQIENIVAPEVESSADLSAAQTALDQLEVSDSLDESQFDADVEELL